MTQDQIIEMLRASCDKDKVDPERNGFWVIVTEELERFAKLVAQHEREACAKIVEESSLPDTYSQECLPEIANDIRARGQA